MRCRLRVAPALVTGSLALSVALAGPAAGGGEGSCGRLGAVAAVGTVANAALTEISGLAASRAHPGVLWTHNDSGDGPELYAMAADGADLGAFVVEGAEAIDWEDLAVGPGPEPDRSYLYAADIGDNNAARDPVTVYRVPEPTAVPSAGGTLAGTETVRLRYPGGPADAEALLVDPVNGDLVVVTKTYVGTARILRAPAASIVDGATVTLTDEGTITLTPPAGSNAALPGMAVTGGDISPDGSLIALRTYQTVLVFDRVEGGSVAEALLGSPCSGPQATEPQGEAIAFTADGSAYLTASEGSGVPLNAASIAAPPAPSTTATTPTTSTPVRTGGEDGDDGGGGSPAPIVAGVVVAAGGIGAVLWWARRRRAGSAAG